MTVIYGHEYTHIWQSYTNIRCWYMTVIYEYGYTHIWLSYILIYEYFLTVYDTHICVWEYSYMIKLDYHMNGKYMIICVFSCTHMICTYMIHCTYMTLIYEYTDIWHSYMSRVTDAMYFSIMWHVIIIRDHTLLTSTSWATFIL